MDSVTVQKTFVGIGRIVQTRKKEAIQYLWGNIPVEYERGDGADEYMHGERPAWSSHDDES